MKNEKLFIEALSEYASSKTMRYFLRSAIEGKETLATAKLADIIATTDTIRNVMFKSSIISDSEGGMWNIRDYVAPSFLCKYMTLRQIYFNGFYASRDSAWRILPEEKSAEGRVVSPALYNHFWDMYNLNQNDYKLPLEYVQKERFTIMDFESMLSGNEDDDVSSMNYIGGTKISREIAFFNNVRYDEASLVGDYLPSAEEVRISIFKGTSNYGGTNYGSTNSHSSGKEEQDSSST